MNPFVRTVCYLLVISIISHTVKAQIEKTQSTLISERIQKNTEAPGNISKDWYQEAIEIFPGASVFFCILSEYFKRLVPGGY